MIEARGREVLTDHKTGTPEEWLTARLELLKAEKELTRRGDEVTRRRQELPWVRIDKKYSFETEEGTASLADLFRGCSQLLIYHFMFGPNYTAGCPACSFTADSFNGVLAHLRARDVTMLCVSRAPLKKLLAYRKRLELRLGVELRERLQSGLWSVSDGGATTRNSRAIA
jgi:predicted dithiol-disulfide oxidoreductase (DUF899 family)